MSTGYDVDQAFLEKWADPLDEMNAIIAGRESPTRATFMALSFFVQALLEQIQGMHDDMALMRAELDKRDRNRAKRQRRETH